MDGSVFRPPGLQHLNDDVIGYVDQRRRPTPLCNNLSIPHDTMETAAEKVTLFLQSELDANARAAAELNRRRERNRMHQARYKKKQNQQIQDLETSIQQLHEEIHELRVQRVVISSVPVSKTMWSVVAEYFRLFRFGVQTPTQLHSATESLCPFEPRVQRDFLQSAMTPDVTDGFGSGVDTIMDNWTRMSLCIPGLSIELKCMENDPGGSLVASTTQRSTITEEMLRFAFPHLISKSPELVEKLLGQQIAIRGTAHFEWDHASNRVGSFVFKADMLTPMLHLLGNIEDVSRMFEHSRLTPECGLGVGAGL